MFISDKISLRVKEALPRRSGDGSPFLERGLSSVVEAASPAVIFWLDVDDDDDDDDDARIAREG